MLAGPAIIGPLTRLIALNLALLLPMALCFTAAYAAGVLRPAPQPARRGLPVLQLCLSVGDLDNVPQAGKRE